MSSKYKLRSLEASFVSFLNFNKYLTIKLNTWSEKQKEMKR